MLRVEGFVLRADAGGSSGRQPAGRAAHVRPAPLGAVVGDGIAAALLRPRGGAASLRIVSPKQDVVPPVTLLANRASRLACKPVCSRCKPSKRKPLMSGLADVQQRPL